MPHAPHQDPTMTMMPQIDNLVFILKIYEIEDISVYDTRVLSVSLEVELPPDILSALCGQSYTRLHQALLSVQLQSIHFSSSSFLQFFANQIEDENRKENNTSHP
jgi:hypothetical protein